MHEGIFGSIVKWKNYEQPQSPLSGKMVEYIMHLL